MFPNLGTLDLWVLELFAMYATDERTDGWTDKSNAYCPLPYGRGHNKCGSFMGATSKPPSLAQIFTGVKLFLLETKHLGHP